MLNQVRSAFLGLGFGLAAPVFVDDTKDVAQYELPVEVAASAPTKTSLSPETKSYNATASAPTNFFETATPSQKLVCGTLGTTLIGGGILAWAVQRKDARQKNTYDLFAYEEFVDKIRSRLSLYRHRRVVAEDCANIFLALHGIEKRTKEMDLHPSQKPQALRLAREAKDLRLAMGVLVERKMFHAPKWRAKKIAEKLALHGPYAGNPSLNRFIQDTLRS